ncbi:hypothetical protein AAU57_12005 [Nonlabens sp. YIK11]|uniref:hypothetical protein n=1 Tax=Nonlabens sp. YIK11 TaxID=1453349 RepID=UPI0006DC31C1|nr:hypothetical protein [Nonlabens sp. YIK11]KQC33972.1 hypothetical protein AAU57_12005 [Nonlabens sp. YIK11]
MDWIKIDKNNLVDDREVLAANFEPRTFGYQEKIIGYLSIDDGKITCVNEYQILQDTTHYIDIDLFDLKQ